MILSHPDSCRCSVGLLTDLWLILVKVRQTTCRRHFDCSSLCFASAFFHAHGCFASGFPIFSTSATDLRLHNNFSCVWLETVAMAFALAAQQLGVPDNFVAFARSGCISAAKHSRLFWAGDQLISWDSRDGIGSALTAVAPPSFSFHHQSRHQGVP